MQSIDNEKIPYVPISCEDYDYIELACMERYTIEVVTNSGSLRGLAQTTATKNGGEFFVIQLDNGMQQLVRIDQIRKIVVLSDTRRFNERIFKDRPPSPSDTP